jgi:hypothetical protein
MELRSACSSPSLGTRLHERIVTYEWISAGRRRHGPRYPMGLWIPDDEKPERIALSHSFGGSRRGPGGRRGILQSLTSAWTSLRRRREWVSRCYSARALSQAA